MKCFCIKSMILMAFLLFTLSAFGSFADQCIAADYGLGISFRDSDPRIYVPINITDEFRTELSIYYGTSERESSASSSESKGYEFGLGLYGLKNLYENTQMYYGCKFLYYGGKSEYEYNSTTPYSDNGDYKSYTIAPTLGVEYFLTQKIALGGEFEFYYEDSSYKYDDSSNDSDYKRTGTNTHLILRYYFK